MKKEELFNGISSAIVSTCLRAAQLGMTDREMHKEMEEVSKTPSGQKAIAGEISGLEQKIAFLKQYRDATQ